MKNELQKISDQLLELSQRVFVLAEQVDRQEKKKVPTDREYVAYIVANPSWPNLSINDIRRIVKSADPNKTCGKTRAIRLRDKAKEQSK